MRLDNHKTTKYVITLTIDYFFQTFKNHVNEKCLSDGKIIIQQTIKPLKMLFRYYIARLNMSDARESLL